MATVTVTLTENLACGVGDDVIIATSLGRVAATISSVSGKEYVFNYSALPQGLLKLNACDVQYVHCGKLVEGYACVAPAGAYDGPIAEYDPSANNGAVVITDETGAVYMVWPDGTYVQISTPGGVTDHGALTGLGDDDHPQYNNDLGMPTATQAEMEAGVEADLRAMSPLLVAQAIAALASGGWFSTLNATNLVSVLSSSPIGYAPALLDTLTEDAYGVGLQSASSTQQSDTIGLEFPVPGFVTAYDPVEAIRIRYFGDSTNGAQCKLVVEVVGVVDGGANVSLYTSGDITVSVVDTVEELLITAGDLGATIYDSLAVRLTFYTKDGDAIYVTAITVRGS